jgi:adenylate cyclase
MAAEPQQRALALPLPVPQAPAGASLERSRAATAALSRQVLRRLTIVLPIVNLTVAAITYVFVEFVIPLPGAAPPAAARGTALEVALLMTGVCWIVCDLWGRHTAAPVTRWLEQGGDPAAPVRGRAVRLPLLEAGHAIAVWAAASIAFGVLEVAVGGSVAAGALVVGMILEGALVVSALTYLATERIMRPVVALALESGAPSRPLLPGIATRLYLAWEFGTASAVAGIIIVAVAYLTGGGMSPHRMAVTVIFLGGIASTIGLITLLAAVHSVADPVRGLRRAMAKVEAGDTDVTVPVDDGSEVGLLQAGFNRMLAGLRERDYVRDLFGRHVGEEVARSALRGGLELEGELRDASVLFVDICGSTAFAAAREPTEVVGALNRFFGIVVEVVTLYGGWINKFEGDAALCVFGAPTQHPDAAGAALAAARELRRRLRAELEDVDAAIGVSAGTVVAGNVGAAKRYEYTVIGDPVNEAARLTELAKTAQGHVVASGAIVKRAGEREAARWRLGEPVVLRGRPEATVIATPALS